MSAISQTTIHSYFHHSKRHVRKSWLRFTCFIPNAFPLYDFTSNPRDVSPCHGLLLGPHAQQNRFPMAM